MVGSELTTWVVPSARCPNGCGLREPQFHAAQRAQCGTSGTVLWKRQRLPGDCGGLWVGISVGMGEMVVDLMHIFWWFGYENKLSLFIYIYIYIYIHVCVCLCVLQHVVTLKQHMFRLAEETALAASPEETPTAPWRFFFVATDAFCSGGYTTNHDHMMVS